LTWKPRLLMILGTLGILATVALAAGAPEIC
jgi:hypothetical protein